MIRLLLALVLIAAAAAGLGWLANHPGSLTFTWLGYRVETSVFVALALLVALAIAVSLIWALLRLIFRLPSLMAIAARARRRNKGFGALSRGMLAVGAGDARAARKYSGEAGKLMKDEPLTLLLKAQTAQLTGDRSAAERAFNEMLARPETRLLGLRGLYVEARRRSDETAAFHYAGEAQKIAPLAWSGQALLDQRTQQRDWAAALATVESLTSAGHLDRQASRRQRAVLKTAMALEKQEREPDAALALAKEALKLAPDLVPAAALAGRLLGRRGDLRKASRMLEAAWVEVQHPELAEVYIGMRPGDSSLDRFARARTLYRLASGKAQSRLTLAHAAIDAQQFDEARATLAPLLDAQPQVAVCLAMAELEQKTGGSPGKVREWLGRASRAPRDPCWIADGVMSDTWSPVSPVTGALDAFVWRTPDERLTARPDVTFDMAEAADDKAPPPALPPAVDPAPPAAATPVPAPLPPAAPPPAPAPKAEAAPVADPPPQEPPGKADTPPLPAFLSAPADKGQPAPVAAEKPAAEPAPPVRVKPEPVVFPLAGAPDDPGPSRDKPERRSLFS